MTNLFAALAAEHGLLHKDASTGTLSEKYLYSDDMVHRYAFGRWWGDPDPATSDVWVLFNPARGDTEQRYRPTLERCVRWARFAGLTGLVIVNLFAYRHTDPKQVPRAADPVGPANDDVLRAVAATEARTVAAWGPPGAMLGRSAHVAPLLDTPLCLGTTVNGEPRHPGRVPSSAALVPWAVPARGPAFCADTPGPGVRSHAASPPRSWAVAGPASASHDQDNWLELTSDAGDRHA